MDMDLDVGLGFRVSVFRSLGVRFEGSKFWHF